MTIGIEQIGTEIRDEFEINRRVLSFAEYLDVVVADPRRHARSSAQYMRDAFEHYGTEEVRGPGGRVRRFRLFDAPWDEGDGRLVGEEGVQNAIYRILSNFVRQRRTDRFILLHGPNGSSKSTITELIARALEHYSTLDEGAIYRFNWIFPTQRAGKGGIGFAGRQSDVAPGETYAYLEDDAVDARLACDMRDHPLLLIPRVQRQRFLAQLLGQQEGDQDGDFPLSEYLLGGDLCHKCKLVYESLLNSYHGDYLRVLRHIQVERFYVSRRYSRSATRVEPQLAVDAKARQVTADRSFSALPTALQSVNLFELDGALVRGNRGMIDFPDLFKRPVEAFKYLITSVEDGRVLLDQTNLFFDTVFLGSSNDMMLNAFMESPEWMSFKARFELVNVPYLLSYLDERQIYDEQIGEVRVGKHIAPHSATVAALWATLTRMHRPVEARYEGELRELVARLTPLDKAELYASGKVPEEVRGDSARVLRAGVETISSETRNEIMYEGRTGASPREVKTAIMNAAQRPDQACLTVSAVVDQLRELVKETSVYEFLRMEPRGGFFDHKAFIDEALQWYLERVDEDVQQAMGLVEEASYEELFTRYMHHVTSYVSKEKVRNPVTGAFEDPDEKLMSEVETELGVSENAGSFRQGLMTKIGAWSVDHSGEKPDYPEIFSDHFEQLKDSYFERQRKRVTRVLQDALRVLAEEVAGLPDERVAEATRVVERLQSGGGYCPHCAREAITLLARHRYSD